MVAEILVRKGWASYFVEKGYHVYLVDAYAGARSPANDFTQYKFNTGTSAELAQKGFTAPGAKHTQWPGSGLAGDPIFDAFLKTQIPWTTTFELQELAMRAAGCKLLSILGSPSFLISHSLGSFYPILLSNDCPQFVKGSINIEPATTPFWRYNNGSLGGVPQSPWGLTFSRLTYDPPIINPAGKRIQYYAKGCIFGSPYFHFNRTGSILGCIFHVITKKCLFVDGKTRIWLC